MAPILSRFSNIGGGNGGFGFGRRRGSRRIPILATGGSVTAAGITPGNGFRYHVFTAPGTFTVLTSELINIEILAVAGGGGGAPRHGGGGGSGGITYVTSFPVTAISYPITVGTPGSAESSGGDTTFSTLLTSKGGAGGPFNGNGLTGGSGSGGGSPSQPPTAQTGGPASQPIQNPGVANLTNYGNVGGGGGDAGGGGGGAGGSGSPSPGAGVPGAGGPGAPFPAFAAPLISSEIPAPVQPTWIPTVGPTGLYGGGGCGAGRAGHAYPPPSPGGGGGSAGRPAVSFTGSGGGGGNDNGGIAAGTGGSGILIIRYQV